MPTIVNAEQAKALLSRETVRVLDMRDFRSYRAGHIEGAVLLHDGLEESLMDEGAYEQPMLLYCYRGIKSKEKAEYFVRRGFERVYTLEGGYTDWPHEAQAPARR